ncbi:ribonuclease Y [Helicobacter didelphidarum]|uniref:Ribonuclease Y n=1 Tax=Helicobacter didelphidarum TaxID=2040648 RepID=A0A3D8ID70_9HELI|nr:ribonuclease Y [Helicobacter didelphidarum]RDU63117.1 ribonuclease Y [Helicobacter didelphidarum]
MSSVVLYCIIIALFVMLLTLFIMRKIAYSKMLIHIDQNNAKIKVLESEIDQLLHNRHAKMQEKELKFEQQLEKRKDELESRFNRELYALDNKYYNLETRLKEQLRECEKNNHIIESTKVEILRQKEEQKRILAQCEMTRDKLVSALTGHSALTKEESKKLLLECLEGELAQQKANLIRRYENEAKEEAKKRANYIIAQATTRFAGDFASERLINVVNLPNDEMKGKIIGKEGRNIRAFEAVSGVNLIIEDTPNAIILSSFNLYRRAIATKTLEILVEDGRIQPSRIEEIYEKVKHQMEEQIYQDGDEVVLDLGVGYIHPELKKLIGKLKYRASFGQNALCHSLEVARIAGTIAGELGGDEKLARRAGILHDIGKALTDEQSGSHVDLGAEVCLRYKEHPVVINAIRAHHGHEESQSVECSAVCTADVLSAARPGARHEMLENYLNRVQNLEKIAMEKFGVRQAYAVHAGREVRVIVRADLVNDSQTIVLAKEIANDVKQQLQYPGEIKVNVIREIRSVEIA